MSCSGGTHLPANRPSISLKSQCELLAQCRDGYLPGVQALARSLQAVGTRHQLLVMYTPDTLSTTAVGALQQEPGCQPLPVERYMPAGACLQCLQCLPADVGFKGEVLRLEA